MKILHTADWHIGSKLNGVSRKEEQQAVLDEIVEVAKNENVDIVLLCGDIFHDSNSSSYADKMVIETLIKLADNGRRAVVVLMGNHDDDERLTASKHFAERENIFLIDSLNYDYGLDFTDSFDINLTGVGKGYLKFKKGKEELVLNLMPYPAKWFRAERFLPGEDQMAKLKRLFCCGTSAFEPDTINISAGHFFVPNSKFTSDIYSEVSEDMIPKSQYTALGHVHDMLIINENRNIVYCGSPYQVYPTEAQSKYVVVATLNLGNFVKKEFIKIKTHKKIEIINANSFDDCVAKLANRDDSLVSINVHSNDISAQEIKKIRENFSNIISFNIVPSIKKTVDITKKNMTNKEIFTAFYKNQFKQNPEAKLVDAFENVLKGGEDETD